MKAQPLTLGVNLFLACSKASLAVANVAVSGGNGSGDGSTAGTSSHWNLGCHLVILWSGTLSGRSRFDRNSYRNKTGDNEL